MNKQGKVMLAVVMVAAGGYTAMEYVNQHPASASLPSWIGGEFGASAARYAGRTVSVDSAAIRFSHGDGTAEVALPAGVWTTIGTELGSQTVLGGRVTLGPWGVCLAKRA